MTTTRHTGVRMTNGSIRRAVFRWLRRWAPRMALTVPLLAFPGTVSAQAAEWSGLLAIELARALDQSGGPALGAVGASARVFHQAPGDRWAWGGSLALHRPGTFEARDVPDRTERMFALGIRRLRGDLRAGWFANLGLDLLLVEERPEGSDWSRDPGVGAYVGAGWIGRPEGGAGGFGEIGLIGALATGENTAGGGVYLTIRVGLIV